MKQQHLLVLILAAFITTTRTQDTTAEPWKGDTDLCPDPAFTTTARPSKPMPTFARKAEFAVERIEVKHIGNFTFPSTLTRLEYLYDYDANRLIMVKNQNDVIDVEYFYYNIMKKSTYYQQRYCVVDNITANLDMDGASAIQTPDGKWHIRPLNEFLLFSNIDPSRPTVYPTFLREDTVRGIAVDLWQSCYLDPPNYRTVRRIWALARNNFTFPSGVVGSEAVPVQAMVSSSIKWPNGTRVAEVDEIFNVFSYRPGISENANALSPPKGVFCKSGPEQNLVSLQDLGIGWPNHFSVRVETSSSRSSRWQRFHLRYNLGRDGVSTRRLRYDYMPPGAEDYTSVIHDYGDQLTYTIDRRLGSCKVTRLTEYPDVSPIRDPIEFFIKYEQALIFDPPKNAWEFNGLRICRGETILCATAITSVDNFPPRIESDTGKPTNETWLATNIEYSWSKRDVNTIQNPNLNKTFDYPVSLYMRMFRFEDPLKPDVTTMRVEDIEYEFYEMSEDRNLNDFDISQCYRANSYDYLHVFFKMDSDKENSIDGNSIDRRRLEYGIIQVLREKVNLKFSRIADLDIEHEKKSNDVTVFFTILGQTRIPETDSYATDEPSVIKVRDDLTNLINGGQFSFSIPTASGTDAKFQGVANSLKSASQYMSTHIRERRTVREVTETTSPVAPIIVGLLLGILIGVLLGAAIRICQKQPMPGKLSFNNPIPPISFSARGKDVPARATADA